MISVQFGWSFEADASAPAGKGMRIGIGIGMGMKKGRWTIVVGGGKPKIWAAPKSEAGGGIGVVCFSLGGARTKLGTDECGAGVRVGIGIDDGGSNFEGEIDEAVADVVDVIDVVIVFGLVIVVGRLFDRSGMGLVDGKLAENCK